MKLLFENWRQFINEEANSKIVVKYPDKTIPKDLLVLGNEDSELTGFVHPKDTDRKRAGIYMNNKIVGFMTPRQNRHSLWRVGAIYIHPDFRKQGIASKAIGDFLATRDAAKTPIGVKNTASQGAFSNAGFALLNPEEILTDKDGWKYQMWGREL